MGFCLFNNAGDRRPPCADETRRRARGDRRFRRASRQRLAGDLLVRPTVMYGSTHQMPLYPGTGAASERGEHDTIVNAPLRPGDGGEAFRAAFETVILPRLARFPARPHRDLGRLRRAYARPARQPQFAGGRFRLGDAASSWRLPTRAREGRVVSVLEGGYDLEGLRQLGRRPCRAR